MQKIHRIDSGRPMDGQYWEVGGNVYINNKPLIITEIKDESVEIENSVHLRYNIISSNKVVQTLINIPVIISYDVERQ